MHGRNILSLNAYKFKLHIKDSIEEKLAQYAGNCRFVYNEALQRKIESWEKEKRSLSYPEQSRELTNLKKRA